MRDINSIGGKVIPHFIKYPLRGTKYLDFLSFKEAFDIINKKEHLLEEGINKIHYIKKSMNSYREFATSSYYYPIHTKKDSSNYIPITGHYINGFIAVDGSFVLKIKDANFARMSLQVSQHKNNRLLLENIANYFKSPDKIYYLGVDSIQLNLNGIRLWETIIFNHFIKYPLYGSKKVRLGKLFLIRELMFNKNHLNKINSFIQWRPEIKLRIIEIWKS